MNTEINEVEINGIKYVKKDSIVEHKQYEWVYIGRFERTGNDCKLHNAYNIRNWGTTKGLAELVNGATKDTKLDKCDGLVEFDWLTVIHTIAVNSKSWPLI